METEDRVKQCDWLRSLAGDIAQYAGEGTAEEMVEFALNPEGWNTTTPSWFDEHDRRLLTQMVERRL